MQEPGRRATALMRPDEFSSQIPTVRRQPVKELNLHPIPWTAEWADLWRRGNQGNHCSISRQGCELSEKGKRGEKFPQRERSIKLMGNLLLNWTKGSNLRTPPERPQKYLRSSEQDLLSYLNAPERLNRGFFFHCLKQWPELPSDNKAVEMLCGNFLRHLLWRLLTSSLPQRWPCKVSHHTSLWGLHHFIPDIFLPVNLDSLDIICP